jgi:hypothetical protein
MFEHLMAACFAKEDELGFRRVEVEDDKRQTFVELYRVHQGFFSR